MDFLDEVRRKLDIPPAEREQVMKELEDHYSELREELQTDGMNECEAAAEAARRLGNPDQIAGEIQTVHCQAGWKTALMAGFPFILVTLHHLLSMFLHHSGWRAWNREYILAELASGVVVTGIMAYPTIREWSANRRPIWLATWLACGLQAVHEIVHEIIRLIHPLTVPTPYTYPDRGVLVCELLIYGMFGCILLKGLPKWQRTVAVVTVAVAAIVFLLTPRLASYASIIGYLGIPAIIALGLFARHPWGGIAPASLFLFFRTAVLTGSIEYWFLLTWVLCFCAVVLFARQTSWQGKLAVLLLSILAIDLFALSIGNHGGGIPYQTAGIVAALQCIYIIAIPMFFGWTMSHRNPELAR